MFSLFDNGNEENLLQKFLSVKIDDNIYAFKVEYVKEIIPVIEIFTIDTPNSNISGIINLRGENIPVYDVRLLSGKKNSQVFEHQKFIILTVNGTKFALLIDSVGNIVQIQEDSISPLLFNSSFDFLSTAVVEDETFIVLDVQKFVYYVNASDVFLEKHNLTICENSLTKIKDRTSLINTSSSYALTEDSFLNEKFIVFQLGIEIYAFNIAYVKEIKKIPQAQISQIPCVPDFILGIINFRGDYISVLDIKTFLNIEKTPLKEKNDIVILKINNLKIAIWVDRIIDITNLPIANLNADNNSSDSFIIGELLYFDDKVVNMLNVEKLFSDENVNIENYE